MEDETKFEGFVPPNNFTVVREIRDYDVNAISNRFEVGSQIEWSNWGTFCQEDEDEIYLKYFATGIISRITVRDVFLEIDGKYCRTDKRDLLGDVVNPVLAGEIRVNIENPHLIQKSAARKVVTQVVEPLEKPFSSEHLGAYRLVDPRNEETFYIGISKNMQRRYKQHLACCGLNYEKNIRIQEILRSGLMPRMDVIEEEIPRNKSKDQERYWIQYYRNLGAQLTNIAEMDEVE